MRPIRMLLIGILVLAGWCLTVVPGYPQNPNAVQSLPIDQVDAIIRQPGHCLVAVMASWCHPCIEELPLLKVLDHKYRSQGLKIIGLSVDYAGPQAMQPMIDKVRPDFPVYWVGEAGLDAYAISRIPLLIFVRNGQTVQRLQGRRSQAEIEKETAAFLAVP